MTRTRSSRVARRLALAAMLLVTAGSTAHAQGRSNPLPNVSQATVWAPGLPGQTVNIWVTVLGGNSRFGSDLVFFPNGFNPNLPFGGGQLIYPGHPGGPGGNPWIAPSNRTFLGTFNGGSELMFGLFVKHSFWVFSGDPTRNADGLTKANNFGTSNVMEDDGSTVFPGTPSTDNVYGFEDDVSNRLTRTQPYGDFNDVLFSVQARVTPEPASLALLASGLIGLGGVGMAHRRRRV